MQQEAIFLTPTTPTALPEKSMRLKSLDALRGFDMLWIVSGEGVVHGLASATQLPVFMWMSAQLHHSKWNGFSFYDLIFPLFIFIAGVSMPFSFAKKLKGGEVAAITRQKKQLYGSLSKRCLALILLGMVVNGALTLPGYASTRFVSVLGRIGLSCFFASLIYLNTKLRTRIIWLFALLLGYWALLGLVPVPGYGAGDLSVKGNLAAYIDRRWLPGLVLRGDYDPEGLLSTIPAIATALLGTFTGSFLRSSNKKWSDKAKCLMLILAGGICLGLGLLWNGVLPINKNMWTSSFVLYAGGWSLLLFGVFYGLIDVMQWKCWSQPFIWLGMNSILIYMAAHGVVDFKATAMFLFGGLIHLAPVIWEDALLWSFIVFIQMGLLYFLFKKRIFLKL